MALLLASSSFILHRSHRFLLLASSDPARSSPVSCFSPGFSYAVVASVNSSLVSPDASSSTCLFNSSSQHIYIIIIIIINNHHHHHRDVCHHLFLITSVLSVGGRWPWWAARQICHWTRPLGQPLHGRVQGHPHSTCTTAQGDGVPTCLCTCMAGGYPVPSVETRGRGAAQIVLLTPAHGHYWSGQMSFPTNLQTKHGFIKFL